MTQPDAQPKANPYSDGDRIEHAKYGTGTVESVTSTACAVRFDDGRRANIVFEFLKPSSVPAPVNDNAAQIERLTRLQKRYGGILHEVPSFGPRLYRATVDGEHVTIGIGPDGAAFKAQSGKNPQPLDEPQPLAFINPADWHGVPVPDRQWYIPDLIPMRQVTILNGDGGVGKSLLALQIAAAGAMSIETLGLEPWAGRTLYIGAEDEAEEFHRRLADIAQAHGHDLSYLLLFRLLSLADADALLSAPDKAGKMRPTALWADIVEYVMDYEPKLIVLDTAADLYGGDEIKRGQVRQFISMLRKLAIELNCAVVLLAHPSVQGMQSGTGSSGSTAWNNSVRSRLYLTRDKEDDDLRILITMKANYGKTGGEIKLRWKDGAFVLDDGKPSQATGLLSARAEAVFRDLLSLFNRTGQSVSDVTGTNYAPAKMAKHPDAKGVTKRQLAEAMQRLLDSGDVKIVMEGPPSRQRKRLILASEDFGPEREAA